MVNAPAQLATATALGVNPSVGTGLNANAQLASALGSALIPATNATSLAFPTKNLQVRVDLLLGGVWTDITKYVYQRNPIQISGAGHTDQFSTLQASQLTLTVNNRDGRFTPKLSTGAYFPNITRNTQVRVFLTVTSATNVSYAGFRFYGEISEWPVRADPSQHDIAVDIVANGIWRRLSQLQTTLGSAYRRFKVNTAAATGMRSYWPVEDGTGSGQIVPYGSVAGTANAIQQFVSGQAGLSFASGGGFAGSDEIATLNGATITATVPSGGTATNNVTRFLMNVPLAGDSAAAGGNWNLVEIDSVGTVARFEVYLTGTTKLIMQLYNSGGALLATGTTTTSVNGTPFLVSCELTPSGGNVNFAMRLIKQGDSGITESLTGTLTGATVGQIRKVVVSRAFQLADTAFGHLSVAYLAPTSLVQEAYALGGYLGEFALDRFKRLCGELGITSSTIGSSSSSAPMGPQIDDTLTNVFQSIEDTDCGMLYELRDQFGMGYRTNASMANQQAQFILDYAARTVDADFAPSYDDQLTKNNVTVSNWSGYTQQAILTAGAMSVLNPPNGIGNGYNLSRSVSAAKDTQCPGIANFLLNIGAVDEIRIPSVTVKMIRSQLANYYSSIPNADIGDYFQITNPPAYLSTTTIRQLIWGYSETLNAREWTFTFNTVPESAWEVGFSPGTIQTAQIPGGSPVSSQAQGSLGLAGLIANGSVTPAMLSNGITIHTFGGKAITVSASAPVAPNTDDIWIASATGLISTWNGSTWTPIKFDASQTIIAGTIIGANIAASTLTASLIAAGQVYAGFVDATIIQAAEFLSISTDTLPDYLAYQGSIGTGNLVTSIAPVAGTDTASNPYPNGIMAQQITLVNQSSAPPAFTGSSVFYSSVLGRPRYISQVGDDSALERSQVSQTNVTMTTQTLATAISGTLTVQSGEANVGSEFEIEIEGQIVAPTGGTGFVSGNSGIAYTFQMMINGSVLGGVVGLGGVYLLQGSTYTYNVTCRCSIEATGAGGTCTLSTWGTTLQQGVNVGNIYASNVSVAQGFSTVGNGKAIDTTTSNTLKIFGFWGSTLLTGHHVTTYRTKTGRRM